MGWHHGPAASGHSTRLPGVSGSGDPGAQQRLQGSRGKAVPLAVERGLRQGGLLGATMREVSGAKVESQRLDLRKWREH